MTSGPSFRPNGLTTQQVEGNFQTQKKNFPTKISRDSSKFYGGSGVTRAHTLESQVHTGTILHHFFHPESPAHTGWSHVRTQPFSRVTRAHRLESQVHTSTFCIIFPPRITRAHITWDRVGWGGVGWGGDDDILLHLHTCSKRCAMDCFGTYFTHVQTCNVTRVQSAMQWTASVHTLHMSKKHGYEPDNLHTWSTQNTQR